MILKKCVNDTEEGCSNWDGEDIKSLLENEEYLEAIVWHGLKMWHLIFLSIAAVLSVIILLCCCVKFRIPRTKQEIEADYIRRKILRKFRKRLKAIQNQELDEMDLKKALDKIRAEFKSDTESLAQSEAGFSAATISSTGLPGAGAQGSTYRRASQIQIDISLEELRAHSLGLKARLVLALSRIFGRSRVSHSGDKVALTVPTDAQGQLTVPGGPLSTKKPDKKKSGKTVETPSTNPNPSGAPVAVQGSSTVKSKEPEVKGQIKDAKVHAKETKEKVKDVKGQENETKEKVKETKDKVKEAKVQTSEVKGQEKDLKVQDKKQKEQEEKERKKLQKEKEKLEKEKEKAEKAKLKIENEKLKKSKEKPEKAGGSKDKPEDKPKEKTDKKKEKEKEKPKEGK